MVPPEAGAKPRVLFLGYLWQVARALEQSEACQLVAVGIEPQRSRSAEALAWCESHGVESFDARRLKQNPKVQSLLAEGIDLCVVGAFGQILSRDFLQHFPGGALNVHFSRLPAYRGGCPLEEQILAGETRSGVSLHWITEGIDEGPLAAVREFEIRAHDDYAALFERAHTTAGEAMEDLLDRAPAHWPRLEQRAGAASTPPRRRRDGLIDWFAGAEQIERLVRADGWKGWVHSPWPGGEMVVRRARVESSHEPAAFGMVREAGDQPLVMTGEGALRLLDWEGVLPAEGQRFPFLSSPPGQVPRVAMMQPTFLPWLGFFSLIAEASTFVFLDDFQFCRRSWHHRNQLFLPGDKTGWITLPVEHPGRTERAGLNQVLPILTQGFPRKMLESIRHAYRGAPFFDPVFARLQAWVGKPWPNVAAMNMALIEELAADLGLEATFVRASELEVEGSRSERIARLLEEVGAKSYLAAAGSAEYMVEDGVFPLEGIDTFFQQFEPTPYRQIQSTSFVPQLSILDPLMQVGPVGTRALLRAGRKPYRGWQDVAGDRG